MKRDSFIADQTENGVRSYIGMGVGSMICPCNYILLPNKRPFLSCGVVA